ncbi:nucleotidyl transferase AbiEii/AbiGii toxin family protein [Pseudothauera nasutitermitis]|uniref:Nucleotidyl transferase AbiEii/AbiGii toxin family protein n=1 Tax=Pseudothauera nasutitermitis TaxID=2565930 RepID=A0A4S4AZS3_9RHOO|nr:nucleotidyl transferase AbiEii/AbiGii toxin family protein [Pseudothauera nasutitermitis]THF64861.1 nucleotidyl transferase AbiEii/AbiGii toxin family protein [Pseudothauera nasutitermitis]
MSRSNLPASIRARLKRRADATRQDFNLTLTHYGLERLLYRLSVSPYADRYLLKGALLFSLWYDHPHRPTRDADLLGFGPDDVDTAVTTFREISQIAVEDGIVFDPASVAGAVIRKEAGYGGVRVDLRATLDGARIALQIDIGFGDAVTPAPEPIRYPVLLDDLPVPQLRAYPKFTVVAEKLHAICLLGMANSRMKDYFDLWVLLTEEVFAPDELRRAVQATFARRKLAMPIDLPVGLSDAFAQDPAKQRQWTAFLKKNGLKPLELNDVVARLRSAFLVLRSA